MWIKLPSCCNYYVDNLEFCPNGGPPDCAPCNVEVEGQYQWCIVVDVFTFFLSLKDLHLLLDSYKKASPDF